MKIIMTVEELVSERDKAEREIKKIIDELIKKTVNPSDFKFEWIITHSGNVVPKITISL